MNMPQVLERAKAQLTEITGLKPVTVRRILKDDGGWHVGLEMLEMSRIPPATDVLGCYEMVLSDEGDLVRFTRQRTRLRGEVTDEAKE